MYIIYTRYQNSSRVYCCPFDLQTNCYISHVCKGSRRPSLASAHSSTSIRSYSAKRYEKEREQKEEREMQKRLARMNSATNMYHLPSTAGKIPPTPSPHSTDDLLPTLEEDKQVGIFAPGSIARCSYIRNNNNYY